ncbi:hypothetical protein HELRODRAFT_165296 [Helobdella robusta]|uniref:Uncharacterized protein n=1 Tax=Helobdella robusta TaxID=6412 RepID=T1EWJ8_HELRO|nr:hypothetical protein HELRODRAFT_165296 [Helobdella robusta]ESN91291.1 hypothetical protein HELRODRAFT_165296 [Helobdella robusta]
MDQLRFEFAVLPASDGKSNVYCVTSITKRDKKVFAIPEKIQSASLHKEFIKTAAYNKIKNSLKKRHQTRKIWITMTNELSNVYMYIDEDGNLQFGDQYLEEIEQKQASGNLGKNTDSLKKLFTKFIESSQDLKKQNLKYFAEKFIIERFTSWNQVTYALLFKYKDGSLVDYAIKKKNFYWT